MSSSELERLRRKYPDRAVREERENADGFTDENLVADVEAASSDAMRRVDPNASELSTLSVHLEGSLVEGGTPDVRATDSVTAALQEEVHMAGGGVGELTRLVYAGFTPGSTVVHLQPAFAVESNEGRLAGATSPVDAAVRRVFDAHDLLEGKGSASQISREYSDLLDGIQKLIKALDRYQLGLDLVWRSPIHHRARRSRLSAEGMRYGLDLLERESIHESDFLTGLVYGLNLEGELTIRVSPSKGKPVNYKVKIDSDQITELGLQLNRTISVRVTRESKEDRFGRRTSPTYRFEEIVDSGPTLHD